jgi:N-methylhydantoinase B/oxoprolinase/acetone carboxylase alpha subunit
VSDVYSKFSGYRVKAGDVLRLETPMGGGYGPPLERDPQAVLDDVLDDYVTIEEARDVYGVVLTPDGLAVDAERTAEARRSRSSA